MNTSRLILHAAAGLLLGMASCNKIAPVQTEDVSEPPTASSPSMVATDGPAAEDNMRITIGSKSFKATLEDSPAVAALNALLPLTVKMTDLNGNEKFCQLSTRLPTDGISPGTIQNGDLMLYGDNTLVLFYKTFKTSYTYTRLGRIDEPSGLAAALGAGDVSVTFVLE